jgi:hypothetical protein
MPDLAIDRVCRVGVSWIGWAFSGGVLGTHVGDVRWREVAGNQKEREIREDSREVVMVVELVVFSSCDLS